jgi:hypothetical protein
MFFIQFVFVQFQLIGLTAKFYRHQNTNKLLNIVLGFRVHKFDIRLCGLNTFVVKCCWDWKQLGLARPYGMEKSLIGSMKKRASNIHFYQRVAMNSINMHQVLLSTCSTMNILVVCLSEA